MFLVRRAMQKRQQESNKEPAIITCTAFESEKMKDSEKRPETIHFANRKQWRSWLGENHSAKEGVWLVFYKKHAGKTSLGYEDAVEEALCFGWIDSVTRRVDEEKYILKFSRRKAKSIWSQPNKKRVEKLIKKGFMTKAGLAKVQEAKTNGSWNALNTIDDLRVPNDLQEALSLNLKAMENFKGLAPSQKKLFLWWIESAKREETRARRIRETVKLAAKNKRL